ncbi:MAG: sigma 54-interacting transcriptional regulator [Myxococcales bacterium]|nr:sigma 54-interacting transcriptional regulator [Myxococcales bacterium]
MDAEPGSRASLADVLRRGLAVLDPRLGVAGAALVVEGAERGTLSVAAAVGMTDQDLRLRPGLGVAGRVVETGRPILVPSVRREAMAAAELAGPDDWRDRPLSLVSAPVLADGRCLGALSVYFAVDGANGLLGRLRALEGVLGALAARLRTAQAPEPEGARRDPQGGAVFEYANMIGATAAMRQVYEEIGQVAPTTATVLILGESGTGKELVAEAIHANSERAAGPFIKINGAAFPETLFESELFGHERGAFTGAVTRKRGRLDLAQGGTLFLDEIGELPLSTQVKLLRVLQSREYERLGGTETLRADVRLIAATNKNMTTAVASGAFREDLFYRLNVFTIALPPLRDRRADVPALSEYFLEKYAAQHRRGVCRIASGALDVLCQYHWPGNVRELENAIERAVVVCDGVLVEERHLPEPIRTATRSRPPGKLSLAEAVEQLERQLIEDALRASGGNLARASRALGATERVVRYKVKKYRLGQARGRSARRRD